MNDTATPADGEFDVIVIGAGYGGTTVAALLAHAGRKVALVEKTNAAGGKAQTVDRKGYRYEMFGAVGIPADGSRFHELVDTLGIADRAEFVISDKKVAATRYRAPDGTWHEFVTGLRQTGSPEEIEGIKNLFGVSDVDLARIGNLYMAALAIDDDGLAALDHVGMLAWMAQFDLPAPLVSQVATTLNMALVAPMDRLAASEGVLFLRQLVAGGAGRYHVGGYGRVAEVCAEVIVESGGTYLTNRRVREILVENGRAVGIRTDDGILRARAVISNAGIQPTVLALAGADHFPAEYVERVRNLEMSWALAGARYVLDTEIFEQALIPVYSDESWLDTERFARMEAGHVPEIPLLVVDVPSIFDPGLLAEPGHQVITTQVFCSPDPESTMGERVFANGEAVLHALWPELASHVIRREYYGPRQCSRMTRDSVLPGVGGEAIGLAQVVGQVGRSKPDVRTPLSGLYLVGCDAGGRGAGTHQAVDSGFNVAAIVDADLG